VNTSRDQHDMPLAVVSISGGKDSTATAILAIERYGRENCRFVTADTGHEHEVTIDYVTNYLPAALGVTIDVVKADFTVDIARKRRFVAEKWAPDLISGRRGKWVRVAADVKTPMPAPPADPYRGSKADGWVWSPARRPMAPAEAEAIVVRALGALHPTGIPFLDLCLMKGRFPSRKAQFCTEFLKRKPLDAYLKALLDQGYEAESWQGVRRDESLSRRHVLDREYRPEGWWIERPIASWTADQVFALMTAHGIKPNPLYRWGCKRVGCWTCINCGKDEVGVLGQRTPLHVVRIRTWERLVGAASKRGFSALLHHADGEGGDAEFAYQHCNIDSMIAWAKTSRGGRQFDMLRTAPPPACTSVYGLCE